MSNVESSYAAKQTLQEKESTVSMGSGDRNLVKENVVSGLCAHGDDTSTGAICSSEQKDYSSIISAETLPMGSANVFGGSGSVTARSGTVPSGLGLESIFGAESIPLESANSSSASGNVPRGPGNVSVGSRIVPECSGSVSEGLGRGHGDYGSKAVVMNNPGSLPYQALVPQWSNGSEFDSPHTSLVLANQGLPSMTGVPQCSSGMASVSNYAIYQQQQQHSVNNSSSFHSTLAATGTMIGNIAKGLMEGASPIINNMMMMHKVCSFNQKYIFKIN